MKLWHKRKIVSFLASGNGMLVAAVVKSINNGEINARTGCIVSDMKSARVLEKAATMGIPGYFIDPELHSTREHYDTSLINVLDACKTDLIVTAGYLRLLSRFFVNHYRNRIINIHPSLLPSFPGLHSQKKAIEYGVKISGCTSHFIDEGVDSGPIILQSPISVHENDTAKTLSQRILHEEFRILTESVRLFCNNKLKVTARNVNIHA